MNDDAYIPANERERSIRILLDGGYTGAATKILQSHAVLDSVAQEQATALRSAIAWLQDCLSDWEPSDAADAEHLRAALDGWIKPALMRFDNLNKKAGTE